MMDEKTRKLLAIARNEGVETPPEIRAALNAAANDSAEQQRLEQEQAFDRAFSTRLNEMPAPSSLQDRILAATREQEQARTSEPTPMAREGWFAWIPMGVAACLVALLALTVVFQPTPVQATSVRSMDDFVEAVGDYSSRVSGLNYENDLGKMKDYLALQESPVPPTLPEAVANLRGFGCKTLKFDGVRASLICFEGDSIYHLFIARRSTIPGDTNLSETLSRKYGDFDTVIWTSGENIYVLTSAGGQRCQQLVQ